MRVELVGKFRHEYKIPVCFEDYYTIRRRLEVVTKKDSHVKEDGWYYIRSLYFDNFDNKVLLEKVNGINVREKFRLRYYNEDCRFVRLEKKSKIRGLCEKKSVSLTKEECEKICTGEMDFLMEKKEALLWEFYAKTKYQQLKPKTIVEYKREPYIYGPGNVRVTFDTEIKTGIYDTHFFKRNPCVETNPGEILMEVKYDAFLPAVIQDIIQTNTRHAQAFSKYARSRIYG